MITTVSTSAALVSALGTARSGDTILLKSGLYSPISLANLNFSSSVTIASEAGGVAAKLAGLKISNCSGLAFRDLEFVVNPAGGTNQFLVSGSQNIHLSGLDVHGTLDGNPQNDAAGLELKYSSNITITDSEFHELYYALGHRDISGLTVIDNTFHNLRMDGIRGAGTSNLEIASNTFRNFHRAVGDHSDAIQFWNSPTVPFVSKLNIHDNIILRDDGTPMQGIFLNIDNGTQYYRDVSITQNLIVGASYNGISVWGATNLKVEGNTVVGLSYQKAWIRIENVAGGSLAHNSANTVIVSSKVTGVAVSDNTTLPLDTDNGAAILAAWVLDQAATVVGQIVGGGGADTLTGTAGMDTLVGGGGVDRLTGGAGNDLYVAGAGAKIIELLDGGVDTIRTSVSHVLGANVENLELTGAASADAGGNELDNVLVGNVANNRLFGWAGNDVLEGGAGDDVLDGGDGVDTASYEHAAGGVTVNLLTGWSKTYGAGADTYRNIENVRGSAYNDILSGNAGTNVLSGHEGADRLIGNGGADTMTGGTGADMFFYTALNDSTAAARDKIVDFNRAEGDIIHLRGVDANANLIGDQAFTLVTAFTKAAGQLTISYQTDHYAVQGDVNGDGVADFAINVHTGKSLLASDFVL
ncbi:right-handed parallel beta-helix repeat-containing protein [uncultured Phenylobacterium sp.]|uniref:right-handed parallel beta-helix repeat-containing protein n=1 Tax=uncultured Phenylobacterium sp. TaxID=349273 RepID=UPI0025EB796B|nr:right-handed parallel beta-helix repeat-containing protein [uncultured Phenylobacterium sp.]